MAHHTQWGQDAGRERARPPAPLVKKGGVGRSLQPAPTSRRRLLLLLLQEEEEEEVEARAAALGTTSTPLSLTLSLSKTGSLSAVLSTVLWRFPGDRREAILGLRADLSTTKRCWRGTLLRFGQRGFGLLEHLLLPPRSAPVAAPDRLAPYPSTLTTAPSYSPGPRDLLDAAHSAPGGRVSGGCLSAMPFSGLLASAGELLHTP